MMVQTTMKYVDMTMVTVVYLLLILITVETIVTASIPTMIQKLPLKLQPQRQRPYAMYNG